MEKRENKMGTTSMGKLIMQMSGPAIISMLINSLYNIVDSIFVARIGEDALTAVSLAFPVQMLIVSAAVGTGVGINSLIARRLGGRRFEEADRAATSGLKLGVFNWIIFLLFGIFGCRPFMEIFSSDTPIVEQGITYLSIVSIFSIFSNVGILVEKIFQATGNMIFPMITMIAGAIINIVLDPILIFGLFGMPKMGIAGAAAATVFSQFVSMTMGLVFLKTRNKEINVEIFSLKIDMHIVKEIYAVGAPSILMQAIVSILMFGMNAILASFSSTAVAVLGVYSKLQSFVFMPSFGVNQGALPIMGYNYGANNRKRMLSCYKLANIITFFIMLCGMLIFQLFPVQLLKMFDSSPEMTEMGVQALRTISLCFIPAGFGVINAGLFQATGHGMMSMWGSLIRQFIGTLPCAYFFGKTWGLQMVWFAFPAAEILGVIYYVIVLKYVYEKSFRKMGSGLNE